MQHFHGVCPLRGSILSAGQCLYCLLSLSLWYMKSHIISYKTGGPLLYMLCSCFSLLYAYTWLHCFWWRSLFYTSLCKFVCTVYRVDARIFGVPSYIHTPLVIVFILNNYLWLPQMSELWPTLFLTITVLKYHMFYLEGIAT